jgi:hypothetical protein
MPCWQAMEMQAALIVAILPDLTETEPLLDVRPAPRRLVGIDAKQIAGAIGIDVTMLAGVGVITAGIASQ